MTDPVDPTAPNPAPAGATAPAHPSPTGYAPPQGYAPPPQPYAPPYARPRADVSAAYATPPAPRPAGSALGAIALAAGIVAGFLVPIAAAIVAWQIGLGAGSALAGMTDASDFSWRILTPVRDWVLLGEISFWVGTAFGVWALVQGIVAIVTARGRVAGIIAVVLACLGPVIFGVAVQITLTAGLTVSASLGS